MPSTVIKNKFSPDMLFLITKYSHDLRMEQEQVKELKRKQQELN